MKFREMVVLIGALTTSAAAADDDEALAMTKAVACRSVEGFEKYDPLPEGSLTADEKLIVYYRPLNFRSERKGKVHRAHLTQDARMRRRGEKAVLQSKNNLLDYEPESERPFDELYLKNSISLKGMKPGEYELEIILHDRLGSGPSATASQTLKFKVVPARSPDEKEGATP